MLQPDPPPGVIVAACPSIENIINGKDTRLEILTDLDFLLFFANSETATHTPSEAFHITLYTVFIMDTLIFILLYAIFK